MLLPDSVEVEKRREFIIFALWNPIATVLPLTYRNIEELRNMTAHEEAYKYEQRIKLEGAMIEKVCAPIMVGVAK